MRAAVVGAGAVGARAARQFHSAAELEDLIVVDRDAVRAGAVAHALGAPTRSIGAADPLPEVDVVVLTLVDPRSRAEAALEQNSHVVATADSVPSVRALLDLDVEARERARHVVVGAAFSPGLTCVLARHAAADFDMVDEIHVAKIGTGGPACARQRHAALSGEAVDWRDGAWRRRPGGSGRELCWFPDPVGGSDCYRGALPDALLLVPAFRDVSRVTARMAATRRDRVTAWLPMLRRPHAEGGTGAARVEIHGRRGQARDIRVLGVMDRPAVAAGAVAALAAIWAVEGRLARHGAAGLAELAEPVPFLTELARRGVKAAVFEGVAQAAS